MNARFQFSLRNTLWAMFWASACGASFSGLQWVFNAPANPWGWPWHLYDCFVMVLFYLFIGSPFIATASLFGRPIVGIAVGLLAATAIWFVLAVTATV